MARQIIGFETTGNLKASLKRLADQRRIKLSELLRRLVIAELRKQARLHAGFPEPKEDK